MSRAYASALAGHAGAIVSFEAEFDYGVDCDIHHVTMFRNRPTRSGFSISLQLKATKNWQFRDSHVVYDLEAKTWNDMVIRPLAAVPLYLGLLCLPENEEDWFTCTEERIVFQNCCYFYKAVGDPVDNRRTKTIEIPRGQLLTPAALRGILDAAVLRSEGGDP